MTAYLDLEDALQIISRAGFYVKDLGLLGSALARPKTTLFGEDAYPSLELKAAALMHSLIKNHPMVDGNKRTSWFMVTAFLFINGYDLLMDTETALRLTLGLATDELDLKQAASLIANHVAPMN